MDEKEETEGDESISILMKKDPLTFGALSLARQGFPPKCTNLSVIIHLTITIFNGPFPASFCFHYFFLNQFMHNKNVDYSGIRTRIVEMEGKYDLTTAIKT